MDIYVFIAQQVDDRFQNLTFFYYKNFKRGRSMVESDFETSIIHYETNTEWVRKSLIELKELLHDGFAPEPSTECQYCNYAKQFKYSLLKERRGYECLILLNTKKNFMSFKNKINKKQENYTEMKNHLFVGYPSL